MCTFSHHDLGDAPNVAHLDLISCRYVFPYVTAGLRHQLLARFHATLRPGGYLFLGATEGVEGAEDLFDAFDDVHAIFRAAPSHDAEASIEPARGACRPPNAKSAKMSTRNSSFSLEHTIADFDRADRERRFRTSEIETLMDLVPVGLIVCADRSCNKAVMNRAGAAILGHSEEVSVTLDLVEPLPYRMYANGRRLDASEHPLQRAVDSGETIENEQVRFVGENGEERELLVSAQPLLDDDGAVRGAIAAFMDVTGSAKKRRALEARNLAQSLVGQLSLFALSQRNPTQVLERAVHCVAEEGFATAFEITPDRDELVLRASWGWEDDVSGELKIPLASNSQPARTAVTGKRLIVEGFGTDENFSSIERFTQHGITSSVTVARSRASAIRRRCGRRRGRAGTNGGRARGQS